MSTKFISKKPAKDSAGFSKLISSNWIILVVILLVLPYIIKWVSNAIAQIKAGLISAQTTVSNSQNGQSNPSIIETKSFDIYKLYPRVSKTDMERYKAVAQKLAICLGTNVEDNHFVANFDFYNIKAWSEDEAGAVKVLKTVPTTFPIVEKLYFHVFTRSRNLKTDLYKYLSVSDLDDVRKTWKKYGTQKAI